MEMILEHHMVESWGMVHTAERWKTVHQHLSIKTARIRETQCTICSRQEIGVRVPYVRKSRVGVAVATICCIYKLAKLK